MTCGREKLAGSPAARLEVEILLAHALETTRSFLYANPELELPRKRAEQFKDLLKRRAGGEPIAYLTGKTEFWSLPLRVSPDVLIPRPETESVVATALDKIPPAADWRIADLGTGSGAIALALASERPRCEAHGTDISSKAIDIARENAARLGLDGVSFHSGHWGGPLEGKFHVLVSNPPYVEAGDPHLEQGDLRFEPATALSPGGDGLAAIREISALAGSLLQAGGWLILEHGFEQGRAVRHILESDGFVNIETRKDLAGHERVAAGQRPSAPMAD